MAFPSPTSEQSSGERIRLTITVTPEVHATFQRMAAASGTSLGRAMGDWLGDTEQAAQQMATLLERARASPKLVLQELNSFVLGMADETGELLDRVRRTKPEQGREGAPLAGMGGQAPATPPLAPRPVIRGVKSPTTGEKGKRAKP